MHHWTTIILTSALVAGCQDHATKPTEPGLPNYSERDWVSSTMWVGEEIISEGGDDSGVQDGTLVDPNGLFLIDLAGQDCSPALIFHGPLLPIFEDDRVVTSMPLSYDAATLTSLAHEVTGYTRDGRRYSYSGGTYRLLPRQDPTVWEIEVTTDSLCTAPNGIDAPTCGPQDVPIQIEVRVSAIGAGQIDSDEATATFDIVPSEDMTLEGLALPPCVPVLPR